MKLVNNIAIILLIIGGLNWGIIGIFNYDIVRTIFGEFANFIYILIGVSTIVFIFEHNNKY